MVATFMGKAQIYMQDSRERFLLETAAQQEQVLRKILDGGGSSI